MMLQRAVILGVADISYHSGVEKCDPVWAVVDAVRHAASDAGLSPERLHAIDGFGLVEVLGWAPANGPQLIAEAVGFQPSTEMTAAPGGESPLRLVNKMAEKIQRGEAKLCAIGGANLVRSAGALRAQGQQLKWPLGGGGRAPETIGVNRPGSNELEAKYGLALPTDIYPLFENALRARRGSDLQAHAASMGALFSRFSSVAVQNPNAWFRTAHTPQDIADTGPNNRMIAYPYTKYMCAAIGTDQSAAIIMGSEEIAREMGVPQETWIYWLGGSFAEESNWFPSERSNFSASEAQAAALQAGAELAGGVEAIDAFDLYSCFPVAVELACEALGLSEDDSRGLTVTGGLPFAGGPGHNYCTHAVARMVEHLRRSNARTGLVSGVGWYLSKHATTILGREPSSAEPVAVRDIGKVGRHAVNISDTLEDEVTIETYTVKFDKDGKPISGVAVGRATDGGRVICRVAGGTDELEQFIGVEQVGRKGRTKKHADCLMFFPQADC